MRRPLIGRALKAMLADRETVQPFLADACRRLYDDPEGPTAGVMTKRPFGTRP